MSNEEEQEVTEIKNYVTTKEDGEPTGFYNTDIHKPEQIPANAIEITEEVWREYINNQSGYKFSPTGELIEVPPPTQEELDEIERNRPRTTEEKLVILEEENISLMLALTQVYEEKEADKAALQQENIDTMLALTEFYEMMIGGSE